VTRKHGTNTKKSLRARKVVDIDGSILYNERAQSWNNIKLRKEIINEFPELSRKRSKFSYNMKLCRNIDEFKEISEEINNGTTIPICIWIYQDE
jgi:hypothetical protein